MLPFLFGAIGAAVVAVAGAFTAHAAGEKDREAAKHHRQVANELTNKYESLQKKYSELADASKDHIIDLNRQRALDEVKKDCLCFAIRLQQHLMSLMWEIDKEPRGDTLNKFKVAVEQTNKALSQLDEELIIVPPDYYPRILRRIAPAVKIQILKPTNVSSNTILSVDLGRNFTKACASCEPGDVVSIPAYVKKSPSFGYDRSGLPLMDLRLGYEGSGYAVGQLAANLGANIGIGQSKLEDALIKVLASAAYFKRIGEIYDDISVVISLPFFSTKEFEMQKAQLISMITGQHFMQFRDLPVQLNISKVWVMPEGYGTLLWSIALPKISDIPDVTDAPVAIVDIGYENLQMLIVDNFRLVRDASKSESFGMSNLYERLSRYVESADSQSLAFIEAMNKSKGDRFYFPKGAYKSINLDDFLPKLTETFSRELCSRILAWLPEQVTNVIITGGGGEFFWNDIQRLLIRTGSKINAYLATPSRQANALGQYLYGYSKINGSIPAIPEM
ncbi:ParM/StbA family protein [Aliinostoc sp. HNIBRCY26]|uniref:ParM/StbA family protein n=1 Tax=Aliinostoc sp. HNIBRCY26 TaxID=3418997 RepID=UPI003D05699E